MASQPPVQPDIITPQSPDEAPTQPGFTEAPPPMTEPEVDPDGGGDIIEPGQTPDEMPPQTMNPGMMPPD